MYHCRGMEMGETNVYRYRAPSGKETLNYREYMWYNGTIAPEKFEIVPRFCKANGVNTYLCVYGVGDHGGGPSRRDVERILKYRSWPLTPEISFGTFRQFFEAMEQSGTEFPVIDREMNCLFTGCYTTQARIKMANRIAEARINEAEALTAMDSILTDSERRQDQLDGAWRNVLFGHFHDILPGSGTVETREYAMGKFQETLASVSTCAGRAMRSIASRIDTSRIAFDSPEDSISEGGGAGYAQSELRGFGMPSAERGRGTVRAVHVFNPTAYQRNEFTEIVLWDYPCEDRLTAEDSEGNTLEFHVTCASGKGYWGHQFTRVLVKVNVAPFGYATVIFRPRREEGHFEHHFRAYELSDEHINDAPLVLENECIRATFDHTSLELVSLIDKASGESLIDTPSCSLELIEENPIYRMGAWRVGPYMKREVLNRTRTVRFTGEQKNEIFSSISYEIRFDSSLARVEIQLKKDSPVLEFSLNLDWNERPQNDELIPQLRFAVPVSYSTTGSCVCDIPYGEITRSQQAHDVPALSYLGICGSTKHIVGITTDTKYGYRCYEDVGSVTLVRSTNKPDLSFSDRGIHNVRIGVMAVAPANLKEYADCFNHPLAHLSATAHEGTLPLNGSALQVSGTVVTSCLKCAEANDGDVIRLYNVTDQPQKTTVTSAGEIASAAYTDTNEAPLSSVAPVGNTVTVTVGAFSVVTLKIIPKK
jgi:alpha-mannosidase